MPQARSVSDPRLLWDRASPMARLLRHIGLDEIKDNEIVT